MLILLQSQLVTRPNASLPDGYRLRTPTRRDIDEIGRLYFTAYDPGIACPTEDAAIADIRAAFDDAYGEFWAEASPVIVANGEIVAVVQTSRSTPWTDVPPGPFITEVFVARQHRRRGLARAALATALGTIMDAGVSTVSLRVLDANAPARRLYASFGFRQVHSGAGQPGDDLGE